MSLPNKLVSTPHRETSGSDAYAAFEFQVMFGVELLFEKFDHLEDYAVLFEFHDDVVLVTGTTTPSEIEFFQLKHTTTGNWTMSQLSYRPKKKGSPSEKTPSIIQKLYGNVFAFEDFTTNAQIVSNAFCSEFGQAENSKLSELSLEKRQKLLDHLKEVNPGVTLSCLEVLGFRRSELDKSSCYELIKGRVHSFLQKNIGGDAFQLQSCTDSIVTQCRLRNKKLATDIPGNVSGIIAQKGVTKHELSQWLSSIAASKLAPDWNVIQSDLGSGWQFGEVNSVRYAYENFRVVALDSSNDAQNAVVRAIRAKLDGETVSSPLCSFVDSFVDEQELRDEAEKNGYTTIQLKAVVLYEVFKSEQTGTVQETNPKPSKEDK